MRTLCTGFLLGVLLAIGGADAQGQLSIGPEISLGDDVDLGIGAVVDASLASVHENLEAAGRFTLYFPDQGDYWELDADVRYLFPLSGENEILPYALAGIAIGRFSWEYDGPNLELGGSDTEIGLRIGGGFKVPMERFTPFAELGLGIGDIPDFTLRTGLTFPVG